MFSTLCVFHLASDSVPDGDFFADVNEEAQSTRIYKCLCSDAFDWFRWRDLSVDIHWFNQSCFNSLIHYSLVHLLIHSLLDPFNDAFNVLLSHWTVLYYMQIYWWFCIYWQTFPSLYRKHVVVANNEISIKSGSNGAWARSNTLQLMMSEVQIAEDSGNHCHSAIC